MSDPAMTDATIGDVFPADDDVAQFVVVLCVQRNDIAEAVRQVVAGVEQGRSAMHYYHRLVVSHYFEAVNWLAHAIDASEDVAAWLMKQPRSTQEKRDALLATAGPGGLAKTKLWAGRNVTFHYPKLHVASHRLRDSLEAVSSLRAHISREFEEIEGTTTWHPRFDFAEDVVTGRMFDALGKDSRARVGEVQAAALRYVHFADECLRRYMTERGLELGDPIAPDSRS